eukprot:jgi/Hompol1/3279/HPOL_003199-RA
MLSTALVLAVLSAHGAAAAVVSAVNPHVDDGPGCPKGYTLGSTLPFSITSNTVGPVDIKTYAADCSVVVVKTTLRSNGNTIISSMQGQIFWAVPSIGNGKPIPTIVPKEADMGSLWVVKAEVSPGGGGNGGGGGIVPTGGHSTDGSGDRPTPTQPEPQPSQKVQPGQPGNGNGGGGTATLPSGTPAPGGTGNNNNNSSNNSTGGSSSFLGSLPFFMIPAIGAGAVRRGSRTGLAVSSVAFNQDDLSVFGRESITPSVGPRNPHSSAISIGGDLDFDRYKMPALNSLDAIASTSLLSSKPATTQLSSDTAAALSASSKSGTAVAKRQSATSLRSSKSVMRPKSPSPKTKSAVASHSRKSTVAPGSQQTIWWGYEAKRDDELSVWCGDVVYVNALFDDGWAMVTNKDSVSGVIPRDCLNASLDSLERP